jgi:hypothetical protein
MPHTAGTSHWLHWALLVFLPVACSSSASSPAKAPAPNATQDAASSNDEPVKLTFHWPDWGALRVRERVAKKDGRAVLDYTVSWRRSAARFEVKLDDMSFVELNGDAIDTEAKRQAVAAVLAKVGAIPTLVVDASGELKDLAGFDEMMDRIVKSDPKFSPDMQKKVMRMLKDPAAVGPLKERVAEFWNVWVGSWVGLVTTKEGVRRAVTQVELGDRMLASPTVFTWKRNASGRLELTSTQTVEGPEMARAVEQTMRTMTKDVDPSRAPPAFKIDECQRTLWMMVETDPATMIPARAAYRTTTVVVVGGRREVAEESHEYAFSWRP